MHDCCNCEPRADRGPAWMRGVRSFMQWALPVGVLALIPKCPVCLAAYVLLFTGVSLSVPAAAVVRWSMIALSVAVLALLSLRLLRRARPTLTLFGCRTSRMTPPDENAEP